MNDQTSGSFDISQFENVDIGTLTVLNQKGDELLVNGQPVTITLHGVGSKAQVRAERKLQKAAKSVLYAGIGGRTTKNAEDEEFARDVQYLAECTVSIDNFPITGGALALYSNHKLSYITRQVRKFMADEANFIDSSPQS